MLFCGARLSKAIISIRGPKMIDAELNHRLIYENIKQSLSFSEDRDYESWRGEVKKKFIELLGISEIEKNACPIEIKIEFEKKCDGYRHISFSFESEVGEVVPCHLLIPDTGLERYPLCITLQGHSTGVHLSLGEAKFQRDYDVLPRVAFALQSVREGYATLAIEQRGMGEKRSAPSYGPTREFKARPQMCVTHAMVAISLGRTMIGERIWDISRAIDALSAFPECITENIVITGNSGGGTASFYAACYDERISLSVPSCAFSPFRTSIFPIEHCACNYIPSVYKYFDMQDLACLIAPRKLHIVAGALDDIFPIEGVREGFEVVKRIYRAAGCEQNCRLVETPKEHWWCDDIVWQTVREANG